MNLRLVFLCLSIATPAFSQTTNPPVRLTLAECLERAFRHNLDLRLERLNPQISDWGVVSAQSFYDPVLGGRISYQDATDLLDPERAVALGFGTLETQTLAARLGLEGKLPTGASYGLSATESRSSGSLNAQHVYTGGWLLILTQPLLKNAGFRATSASIRIARQTRQISEHDFTRQAMDTAAAVERAYHDLLFAIEDHKAKIEDRTRAQALLADNRKRVEVGVMSKLDVTQAEAGAAEREEAVVVAERAIRDAENVLKRLITSDVTEFTGRELLPAEAPVLVVLDLDVTRSTRQALEHRPEYAAARARCDRQKISVEYRRNQRWPQIDLFGTYGSNARSPLGGSTNTPVQSSFHDYLSNLSESDSPVWSVGVAVSIPLGDRQSRADYRTAQLQAEQTVLDFKRVEQDIVIQVDNAVGKIRTNLQRLEATRVASRLAEESLQAEEQKLRAGSSTSFLVLQAQAQLAAARSAAIRARADYAKSLVDLARAEGDILRQHNVTVK